MSSAFRSLHDTQSGQASPPLLLAAPIVGLVVSVGLDWLTSDASPRPQGEWPVAAVLVGALVAAALAVVVAASLRRQGPTAGPSPALYLVLSALGAMALAGGVAFFAVQQQGPGEMTADTAWLVSLVVGLLVALVGLIVLFTILRRRSQ